MPAMLATTELSQTPSEIFQHLVRGDEQACRKVLHHLREDHGASILSLCDVIAQAFHRIGESWERSELDVYREHIASQIGYRLLLDLRNMLPAPSENGLTAIGCTPERDPYTLPTFMVELVLRELGYRAQSLGTNLPLEMLEPAMDAVQPSLCWVSVSYIDSMERLRRQLSLVARLGQSRGVKIVCGGRALVDEVMQGMGNITFLTQLRELESHATNCF
jgi:methanogenic corrinoid protein MtbC1